MSISTLVAQALNGLVPDVSGGTYRVFPGVAPAKTALPYIVYTRAGGQSFDDLDSGDVGTDPDIKNARIQISVWCDKYLIAEQLIVDVGAILTATPVLATGIGEPVYEWEDETKLHGFRQDFSIFYTP